MSAIGGSRKIAKEVHPEVALLRQLNGAGKLIALTCILTLNDPHRFRCSRDAGCFLGLRPRRKNSGNSEPQLHISKEGDTYLRTLLAHYFLGPFGEDRDLLGPSVFVRSCCYPSLSSPPASLKSSYVRLMINTVLSSIRSVSLIRRR
jgi:hypothetical protein